MRKIRRNNRPNETKAAKLRSKRRMKVAVFITVCVGLLFVGVFFAAQQQFTKWHLSRQNAELRRTVDRLQGERDKLISHREMATSVSELKRSARKAGLLDAPPATNELAVAQTQKNKTVQNASATKPHDGPLVVKTSMVTKPEKPEMPNKESERRRIAAVKPATASAR